MNEDEMSLLFINDTSVCLSADECNSTPSYLRITSLSACLGKEDNKQNGRERYIFKHDQKVNHNVSVRCTQFKLQVTFFFRLFFTSSDRVEAADH